jgi:hypothetical protein
MITSSAPTLAATTINVLFPEEEVEEGAVSEGLAERGEVSVAPGWRPGVVEPAALPLAFVVVAVVDAGAAENPLSWQ